MTETSDSEVSGKPPRPTLADKLRFAFWGIRYFDVLVLMAYPTMGALLSFPPPDFSTGHWVIFPGNTLARFLVFSLFNFLFVTHVYIYNDWSDARLNPEEPKRRTRHALKHPALTSRQVLICSFVLAGISIIGFAFLSWRLLAVALFIEIITVAYSHPVVNLKGRPVVSTLIHFLGAAGYFMGGWAAFQPFSVKEILLAIFFGLVLAAGHFSNEIEDFEQDLAAGIRTNAIAYGQRTVFRVGLLLFLLSSVFLIFISAYQPGGGPDMILAVLLLLAWMIQTWKYRAWKGHDFITRFRRFYRLTYALLCAALIFLKFTYFTINTLEAWFGP